jgi:hypothetical protein
MFNNALLMAAASASAAGFEVTFVGGTGHVTTGATNPLTLSSVDLGSETGKKHIILAMNIGAEPGPISAVTVDGEAATIVIEEGTGVYKQSQTGIAIVELTGVTSGDIVITNGSGSTYSYAVSVFQMIGGSGTAYDTWGPSFAANPTGTIDIVEGGFCVSVAAATTSSTATWAGLTEQFDAVFNPMMSQAWDFEMAAETARSITVTPSGSPSQRVGIGASFKPQPDYISATGGTVTTDGNFKVHTFNSGGTFTVTEVGSIGTTVEYLCIAGGGGGGKGNTANSYGCGGAGAGGYLTADDFSVTAQAYTVTIGAGGSGASSDSSNGSKGSDSVFATVTTEGGGSGAGGGTGTGTGGDGGSGGGGGKGTTAGSGNAGPPRQGFDGGTGTGLSHNSQAGGGGASEVGEDTPDPRTSGGAGGDGLASSITGASVTRAGGGGGTGTPGPAGSGGAGGGGTGATANSSPGTVGTVNTGGGGGAGGGGSIPGSAGGSGVVIIRYQFQ